MDLKNKLLLENKKNFNICVIGAGHVGLVVSAGLAKLGHKVVCVDNNRKKIVLLKRLSLTFFEPGLESLVREGVKRGRLYFSYNLAEGIKNSEVIFIAVGTPPKEDGSVDLTSIENVCRVIARNLNSYKVIIEKSTVPVHTGEKVKETISRYKKKKNVSFDVVSNPEFLREGSAVYDFFNPSRIVLGVESQRAERILRAIYKNLKTTLLVTDINTAELIKHACNSFLATKLSFINAISRICDLAGANVERVAEGMGLDPRIGRDFLKAGVGFGGFCLPKDIDAFIHLSEKLGYNFSLLKEVKKINQEQKSYFVEKIKECLWVLKDKRIAVFGLSFKPGTDDMRFSPSIDIIESLVKEKALLFLYDPQSIGEAKRVFSGLATKKIKFFKEPYSAVKGCDCLCLLTEWEEFNRLNFKKIKSLMRYSLIADGRNFLDKEKLEKLGFKYIGIGR